MKKLILFPCAALLSCLPSWAPAQSFGNGRAARPAAESDTVVLAAYRDGDYAVRRYVVNRNSGREDEFTVRYPVGLADLERKLGDNAEELNGLNDFLSGVMADSLTEVRSIRITGYASPDGREALNRRLALKRADDFKAYVDGRYDLSHRYNVSVASKVADWAACEPLVERSAIPDKEAVLRILRSDATPSAKEQQLRSRAQAWNYMRTRILPQLRRVVVSIDYGQGAIIEERTFIAPPIVVAEPVPVVLPESPCHQCGLMGDGMIIDLDEQVWKAWGRDAQGILIIGLAE